MPKCKNLSRSIFVDLAQDYMDSHPGGRNILKNWAGRESTEEFARYHRNADQCIEDYDYLRLGRMVEETTPDQLADYEVALNGMVYDLRREFFIIAIPLFPIPDALF